ncbi:MAG: hypothetical protein GQ574_16600 [Crocinitomix sp.]|nr:hypothetical protein [Crocinitomix sp.]
MFRSKHILYLLGLLIISCTAKNEADSSPRLKEIVSKLAEERSVYGSLWSYSEKDADHPFCYLIDSTSIDELVQLTDNESPIVQHYAFTALSFRRYEHIDAIVLKHIDDTATYIYSSGCVVGSQKIADFMLNFGLGTIGAPQLDSLRDAIIFNHPYLETFDDIAVSCEGYPPYYDRFKELAENDFNSALITAIATYKKEEDVDYLCMALDSFNNDYLTQKLIQIFPHERFKPHLEKTILKFEQDSSYSKENHFYYAVASYQNNWAKSSLNKLVNAARTSEYQHEYHLRKIMQATEKFDSIYYSNVRSKALEGLNGERSGTDYFEFSFRTWWR